MVETIALNLGKPLDTPPALDNKNKGNDIQDFFWFSKMETLLRQKRVEVLEFEYHRVGAWESHTLNETLTWLAERGYSCFLTGAELAPAYTTCNLEFRKHSNVVCAHDRPVLAKLRSLAE